MFEKSVPPSLDESWLLAELGEQAISYVRNDLHYQLFGVPASAKDVTFRIAPSIVARSECELLAVSAPRFAVRACFHRNGSFANLRRLSFLEKTAHKWGYPAAPLPPHLEYVSQPARSESVANLLEAARRKRRFLADSFFVPSSRLTHEFEIVTTRLHCAYGELDERGNEPNGVPFVQHMKLGGGMCAQAVCFAATALLHEHAAGVHGVAEITLLAQGIDLAEQTTLEIGGCTARDICEYFRHDKVGLSCFAQNAPTTSGQFTWQGSVSGGSFPASRSDVTSSESLHKLAIRAYVFSGMPVIACVDVDRIACEYRDTLRPGREAPTTERTVNPIVNHAVLVVGAGRIDDRLLINDPAQSPFQIVEHQGLWASVPACKAVIGEAPRKPGAPLLLPVTPGSIRLPLLDAVHPGTVYGLITMSLYVWKRIKKGELRQFSIYPEFVIARDSFDPGEFSLVRPRHELVGRIDELLGAAPGLRAVVNDDTLSRLPEWCWLVTKTEVGESSTSPTLDRHPAMLTTVMVGLKTSDLWRPADT